VYIAWRGEHTAETAWPVGGNQPQGRLDVNTAIKASQPAAGNKGALIVDLISCGRRSEFQWTKFKRQMPKFTTAISSSAPTDHPTPI